MKNIRVLLFVLLITFIGTMATAQVLTARPQPLRESSPDVVVTFHADRGDAPLAGYEGRLYAHTAARTNMRERAGGPIWGTNTPKYELTRVAPDVWELYIGDMRQYYELDDPDETILALGFIIRSEDTWHVHGPETFIDLMPEPFDISWERTVEAPMLASPTAIEVTVRTTMEADITLTLDGATLHSVSDAMVLYGGMTLEEEGEHILKAQAVRQGETLTLEAVYTVAFASPDEPYPGTLPDGGVTPLEDGRYLFVLPAPGAHTAMLCGSWDGYATGYDALMRHDGDTFWAIREGLSEPFAYYYRIDDAPPVSDPSATLPPTPQGYTLYDPSQTAFTPTHLYPDARHMLAYEVLPGVTASEALAVVEYAAALGFNALRLPPIYDATSYLAVADPAGMAALTERAHALGMSVLLDLDFVTAHAAHPWVATSLLPVTNPMLNADGTWCQEVPALQRHWQQVLRHWRDTYGIDGFVLLNADSLEGQMDALHAAMGDALHINDIYGMPAEGQLRLLSLNAPAGMFAMGYDAETDLDRLLMPHTLTYADGRDDTAVAAQQLLWGDPRVAGSETLRLRRLASLVAMVLLSPGAHSVLQYSELAADGTFDIGNPEGWRTRLCSCVAECLALRPDYRRFYEGDAAVEAHLAADDEPRMLALHLEEETLLLVVNTDLEQYRRYPLPVAPWSAVRCLTEALGYTPAAEYADDGTVSIGMLASAYALMHITPGTPPASLDTLQAASAVQYYDLAGRPVAHPTRGIYLRRRGAEVTKTVVK